MISGIDHFAIMTTNPIPLANWYIDVLGFVSCYESASTVMVRAQNGFVIEITTGEGVHGTNSLKTPGIRHIAIGVTDFDAVYQSLKARGVNFVGEPQENKGNRIVFFTDPEGNYLHLLQRATPLG